MHNQHLDANRPRYRDHWEEYWFHYRANSAAAQELFTNSDSQAVGFAKLLVQVLVLLHGGALLALPTFFQVFGVSISDHRLGFWVVFTVIASGLLAAVLAGLFAFFALANRADGSVKLIEAHHHRASGHLSRSEQDRLLLQERTEEAQKATDSMNVSNDSADALNREAEPFFTRYGRFRTAGILLVIASVIAFVAAAAVGSVLTGRASPSPMTEPTGATSGSGASEQRPR